jgi:hypothetical protein
MPRNRPSTVKDVDAWERVSRIDECGDGLTEWEINFLDSMLKQLMAGKFASEKQMEIVERMERDRL